MKKDPFTQIIRKWWPKGAFIGLLEKYVAMSAGYEVVCACGFKVLRTFLRIFVMYEFPAAIFIKVLGYQSFDVKCSILSWDACVCRQERMVKDWWGMVFTPN